MGLKQLIGQARLSLNSLNRVFGGDRPASTLLCFINNRFIRVDLNDKGGRVGDPLRLPLECDTITDLPLALTEALKGTQPIGRHLWLLHDGLPNHTVEVPVGQVVGLSDEQVNQALLFELQELTGVVTTNLQSSHVLLSQVEGQNQYWLSHAPKTLIAQLRRTAKEYGCRFDGLLHPAGLPYAVAAENQERAWARLEIWPDVMVGLNGDHSGRCNAWVMQAGAKPKRVQTEVERWRSKLGDKLHWETLGDGLAVDFLPPTALAINLDQDDTLFRWLEAWGQTLVKALPTHIPVLAPPEDPNRERWLMAAAAAVALAVCLGHLGWQQHRQSRLAPDRAFLKRSQAQISGMEMELTRYKKQHDELIKKLDPGMRVQAVATPEVLAALRKRLAVLMRAVAVNSSDGIVIEEIHTKPNALIVKGVSLDAAEANKLASALEAQLGGLGWRIEQPRKKDLALDAHGGPWEFEILLDDAGPAGFADTAKAQVQGSDRCGSGPEQSSAPHCRGRMGMMRGEHVD